MKCPHCEYENEWDWKKGNSSAEGEFFELPVELQRTNREAYSGRAKDERRIWGCPRCNKLFMDRWSI